MIGVPTPTTLLDVVVIIERHTHMKRFLTVISIVSTLTLTACGSGSSSDTTIATSTSVAAEFNGADVMFAQMMIPHHEQAIEMSDMALDPTVGASADIVALATQIKNAQDPEIAQMTSLLQGWGKALTADHSGMDHSSMMSGMLSTEDMEKLGALTGTAFDVAWAKGMIAHHEGAVEMAQDVLTDGSNAEVRTLAQAIVSTQKAEIATLRALLK